MKLPLIRRNIIKKIGVKPHRLYNVYGNKNIIYQARMKRSHKRDCFTAFQGMATTQAPAEPINKP